MSALDREVMVMKLNPRHRPWLVAALLMAAGCGNLSNEDLLFLAAVPSASEVALDVAPPEQSTALRQALVGQPASLYAHAATSAADINQGVENILALVDNLGRGYAPTERTNDTRIWGPVSDVDGKGLTLRLEIRRTARPDDETGPRYEFCVQMGRDEEVTGVANHCGEGDTGGLYEVLGGHYDPIAAQGSARNGSGDLRLDFARLNALGAATDGAGGVFLLDYHFLQDGADKQIAITWEDPPFASELPLGDLSYIYARTPAGAVSFDFALQADIVGGGFSNPFSDALETLRVSARWIEEGAGRGDVTISGGDVPSGSAAIWTECWNDAQLRTFASFQAAFDPTQDTQEGDAASCPPSTP